MIRYRLNLLDVEVSLDSNAPHISAVIEFKGEPVEVAIARDWLADQCGAYGHGIGESTTPVGLAAALTKNPRYAPELLEGEELLDFSVNIPDDAVT